MPYATNWEGLDTLNSTALIQRRHNLLSQMTDTLKQSGQARAKGDEIRAAELEADYEKMAIDEEVYDRYIRNKMTQEAAEKRAAADHLEDLDKRGAPAGNGDKGKKLEYREAFRTWFTNPDALTQEMRALLSEKRGTSTQVVGTTTLGGYTVDTQTLAVVEKALKDYSGIFQAAFIRRTDKGNPLLIPTEDDTATEANQIDEAASITVQDLTYGQKPLDAYKYASQMKISWELMQDSLFDMDNEIRTAMVPRFGRKLNSSCTTGTGTAQPNGVVTASTLGKTAASATAITFAEVIDLKHSVDPAYRMSMSSGFMFHDNVLAALKKLSIGSSDARPLWQPSVREGEPDTIDGSRYWINQAMDDTINASSKLILYGDFSKYHIRMVQELLIIRLNERYAENGLVGFIGHMRWDGECVNTAAIKHLITAAS